MKNFLYALLLCGVSTCAYAAPSPTAAASNLIKRVLPAYADRFAVALIPQKNGKDVFEIESKGNQVVLRGSNAISIAAAFNWYLKYFCHCERSWNGDNLRMPEVLPQVKEKVQRETAYDHRVYLNYCTFSYTAPWWDWERWQREIDWMAMNGINMPLAITGQEAVWQQTLRKFGMSDEEIRSFLVGPAFFAWQWMTNIESWAGPLPQQWIDRSVVLGKQILERERELGMTPILQGFTGYVPIALKRHYPQADITVKPFWLRYFPPGTAQLDPLDPLFARLGKTFIGEQTKLFGTDHLYAGDPFHEGAPPKTYEGYLGKVGKALYEVTVSADPQAKVVMQSWSLREEIARAIPQDRLLVMDLNGKWKKNQAFWGSEWVIGVIHNYGGSTMTGGSLPSVMRQLTQGAGHDTIYHHLTGIGIFPEAIEHNPVIYEAAAEMAWHPKMPDVENWVMSYIHARYGAEDPATQRAWKVLLKTVYAGTAIESRRESTITARPALKINGASPNGGLNTEKNYRFKDLWEAPAAMLASGKSLHDLPTWKYDLVDMTRQCLADLGIPLQQAVSRAYQSGNKDSFRIASRLYLDLISDMDELLASNESFLLGKWIADARKCGVTKAEKDLYERNARWLVTVWGPYDKDAMLFDYSSRQWAGLLKYYYRKRWADFFAFLDAELQKPVGRYVETDSINNRFKRPANEANDFYRRMSGWEYAWCEEQDGSKYNSTPVGDSYTIAKRLYEKWQPVAISVYQ